MQSRPFGPHDFRTSEIGFGPRARGGSRGAQADHDSLAALHRALDLGVNVLATAAGCGNGRGATLIAHVLRGRAALPRRPRRRPLPRGLPRENTAERCAHLGTDRLDLLQLHTGTRAWNRDPTPFKILRELQREGRIGLIGLSTPEHDQNCVIDLMRGGWVDAVQVIYNLFEQEPAAELLDVAQACGVAIIVRVAFDEGALTGKFTAATQFAPDDFRAAYFSGDRLPRCITRANAIPHDLVGTGSTLPQAALQWVLAHPAVSVVIPAIRNVAQAEANCAVSDLPAMPEKLVHRLHRHNWRRGLWYGGN